MFAVLATASVAYADEPVPPPQPPQAPLEAPTDAASSTPTPSTPAPSTPAPSTLAPIAPAVAQLPPTLPPYVPPTPPGATEPIPQVVDRDSSETPPLSGGRVIGEVAIGSLFLVGGTIGGAYIGYGIETGGECHSEFCGFGGAIIGGLVGMTFVTPLGVYLVGNSNGETGSLGATIGGSVIGTLVGVGIAAALEDDAASPVVLVAGPVVGSIIGFNATRRYVDRRDARAWAPVANVSHGTASLGIAGRF